MRVIALVALQLYFAEGFFPRSPKVKHFKSDGGDPGEPLFLTPYVEAGNIEEGRRLARVILPDLPYLESYSGFFTVNETYNSNQFLWYFPPTKNKTDGRPVLLWLQGGPGGSSLFGLFEENGPVYVQNNSNTLKILPRQYHWAEYYHVIYIDNPVGTGFSFTNDSRGYCTDQTQVGDQLHATLVQFFQLFPELQKNKFYITGESYAGKYIPALGLTIHNKNPTAGIKINLAGMFIGDGWCDPINQMSYHKYVYQIGYLTLPQAEYLKSLEWNIIYHIKQGKWLKAFEIYDKMLSFIQSWMGTVSSYNIIKDSAADDPYSAYKSLLSTTQMRKAIHVGNVTFSDGCMVYKKLIPDIMKSVAPWIAELLNYYPIIFYNGQLDLLVAYPNTVNFLRKLDFPESEKYKSAFRMMLGFINDDDEFSLTGFAKGAGNLGEVMVIGAGHMVPQDQPLSSMKMVKSFIEHPLPWSKKEFNEE